MQTTTDYGKWHEEVIKIVRGYWECSRADAESVSGDFKHLFETKNLSPSEAEYELRYKRVDALAAASNKPSEQ